MKKTIKTLAIVLMVLCLVLTGCGNKHDKTYVDDKTTYTMRYAVNSMPTSWNNHTYQSNDATYVTGETEDGLYTFDYNSTKDGYQIVPSMANAMPKDVTSKYVGKYGITEESKNQVYEIELKSWLKFDNGDPITAKDFVESAIRLMNPVAANFRADNFYAGDLKIVNAEKFTKRGTSTKEDCTGGEGAFAYNEVEWEFETDGSAIPAEVADKIFFSLEDCTYVGSYIAENYGSYLVSNGGKYTPATLVAALGAEIDPEVATEMEGKSLSEILANEAYNTVLQSLLYDFWCTDPNEQYGFFYYESVWADIDFSEVGFFAKDDYTLVIALQNPLSGFYLNYALCTNFNLVHIATYDACEKIVDGVYTNSYGTSVETYVGHGPYKLTSFLADSNMAFARNEYWHGYYEEEHKGQYQTTNITYQQVSEASTRLEMFLKGELESYGLQVDDMDDYQGSDFTYYTEGDSTWFIALNPDESALASAEEASTPVTAGNKVVKRIICVKEFRQALSFSVDRAYYELTLDPTGAPAKALYGNMIISDPDKGTTYRTTEEAKKVITDFWGLSDAYGEGKEYKDIDAAIASITGYDLAGAKELFDKAYDIAVEKGYIPADSEAWEIQIIIGQPGSGSSVYYNNGYQLLKQVWTEAVVGTKLEGHLLFTQSQPLGSSGFADYLKKNQVNLLFGVGWTGSALNPYSLIQAYVQSSYQYDPAIDYTTLETKVTIDGKEYSAPTFDWYLALTGEEIEAKAADGTTLAVKAGTDAENSLRLAVLAAIEGTVLQQYTMIPVGLDASASLKCMRVKYYTEEYVYGMGRGGIQYITYAMDDAQWAEYVKSQGGTLDYK